jgi:hypothetical protein
LQAGLSSRRNAIKGVLNTSLPSFKQARVGRVTRGEREREREPRESSGLSDSTAEEHAKIDCSSKSISLKPPAGIFGVFAR